jgi:hypothetical protein
VVRAEGVEPHRLFEPCGFSYRLRLSPSEAYVSQRPICGLDYPFTFSRMIRGLGAAPSSLYIFPGWIHSPGLARDCHCQEVFPNLGVLRRRSLRQKPEWAKTKTAMWSGRWCPGRESNPHGPLGPRDFKSRASANFATRAMPINY